MSLHRSIATTRMTTYIDLMVDRNADGDVSTAQFPAAWCKPMPTTACTASWEFVMSPKPQDGLELAKRFVALFGAVLHVVKYGPEVAAVMFLLRSCLIFPTEEMFTITSCGCCSTWGGPGDSIPHIAETVMTVTR